MKTKQRAKVLKKDYFGMSSVLLRRVVLDDYDYGRITRETGDWFHLRCP
jgi:hypothetical protein